MHLCRMGIMSLVSMLKSKAKAEATHSKVYHLKTTWVMLDDVKQQLILQIGTSNPKCIEELLIRYGRWKKNRSNSIMYLVDITHGKSPVVISLDSFRR